MGESQKVSALPAPPDTALFFRDVHLRFIRMGRGEVARGFVPFYHFHILNSEGVVVGHINFRVGDTDHITLCAGHIGYEVLESFRGRGFALRACRAIAPFVRSVYTAVILTSDLDNAASLRTIEKLGAKFLDEVPVAPHEPAYQRGSRRKKRFRWLPDSI